jgi:hypothetical protein
MKILAGLFCVLISLFSYSQIEGVTFLETNFSGNKEVAKRVANLDSIFVYTTDTLSLPLIDDFSKNHFQQYDKSGVGSNVTKIKVYSVLNAKTLLPLNNTTHYTTIQTFTNRHDAILKKDTLILNESVDVKSGALNKYPVEYTSKLAFPTYTIYDTVDNVVNLPDTVKFTSDEFVQDSSIVFFIQLKDKNAFWLDQNVYRNFTFPINPWTLGVATFDGLDMYGYPYNINTSMRGYGDYLTSKPINLSGLKIKDSVYFSFLYQPKGFGDAPENVTVGTSNQHDSLSLQFYNATYDRWFTVWSKTVSDDPVKFEKQSKEFQKVHFCLKDSTYFKSNFQFRFVNYGDLSGSLDHFHLDYVKFRKNSGYQDTIFKDFAFVYPIGSMIKGYTSVPWEHFKLSETKYLNDSLLISIRNGSNIPENNQDGELKVLDKNNSLVQQFTLSGVELSGKVVNYAPFTSYFTYHDFSKVNSFVDNSSNSKATFKIVANVSAPFLNLPDNDTSYTDQIFDDYYAYDDGTAEGAYGLKSAQARLAYHFKPLIADSLLGVQIHFVPSVIDKTQKQFAITVWNDANGIPGEVIYEDDDFSLREPKYQTIRNTYTAYYFKDFQRLPILSDFYIGLRQVESDPLNIGFDKNLNSQHETFFSTDGLNWSKSGFSGSLMIRPIFATESNKTVSLQSNIDEINDFIFYPNPVSDILTISLSDKGFDGAELLDVNGIVVHRIDKIERTIDLSSFSSGVYFFKLINNNQVHKLIKQ